MNPPSGPPDGDAIGAREVARANTPEGGERRKQTASQQGGRDEEEAARLREAIERALAVLRNAVD